eukprot:gene39941-28279_t
MLWLLLTGEVPTKAQSTALTAELNSRAGAGSQAAPNAEGGCSHWMLDSLPTDMHPMLQFSAAILTLGHASNRNDSKHVVQTVVLAVGSAAIPVRAPPPPASCWAANFTKQLGFESPEFADCMRLYLSIHTDHEGGNVSAHTTTLVGSALSDPYLSLSAGMNGLAGPLHGLAKEKGVVAGKSSQEDLEKCLTGLIWDLLNSKRVVPGYGHAVLRKTDPRYTCQREFCVRNLPDDELFKFVDTIYKITPGILTEHGKTKNPWPNVDAHSGVLLQYYGMTESRYYTVLFGVSRALG